VVRQKETTKGPRTFAFDPGKSGVDLSMMHEQQSAEFHSELAHLYRHNGRHLMKKKHTHTNTQMKLKNLTVHVYTIEKKLFDYRKL
jgi:hypothetical protein